MSEENKEDSQQPLKYDWLDRKLNILTLKKSPGLLDRLIDLDPAINEFNMWTPLKLVCLSYFVGPYVRIINRLKETFSNLKICYFDLFAGTGIDKIKNRNSYFAGSPILTIDCATNAKKYFDEMYFSDLDPIKINALQKRLSALEQIKKYSWIKNRYYSLIGDANVALGKYVDMLKKEDRAQYFAFIDPYRSEIRFENLKKLLEFEFGDILFTLQVNSVARFIGNAIKQDHLSTEKRKEFEDFLDCPESDWERLELNNRENVKNFFINKIKPYKKYVVDVPIKGKNFGYYMIFATRKEDPKWKKILINMKNQIQVRTSQHVSYSIDYLERKYRRVTDFF